MPNYMFNAYYHTSIALNMLKEDRIINMLNIQQMRNRLSNTKSITPFSLR